WITADKMVRTKATSLVEAEGHVVGFWKQENGEKIVAKGERAIYNPTIKVTELWGKHASLTRWQTEADTAPVVVYARYFKAVQPEDRVWDSKHVKFTQGVQFWSLSDEAKYDHREKKIHLWGRKKTRVHFENDKGTGDFKSDRAIIDVSSKKAK